ncbi:MAG: ABC transporter permease, partial [Chloroflexota bacterium]
QPDRAEITASTMMIGLTVVVALAGFATTLTDGMFVYLEKSLKADYLLMPESVVLGDWNVGAAPQLAQSVRETPGVAEVTTLRRGETQYRGTGLQLMGVDPTTYPRLSGLIFTKGDPAEAYARLAQGRHIIVNGMFATQQGVEVGQDLVLQTAEGPQTYRVVGVGVDYLNAKLTTGYISQANLERDFHQTNDSLIMANLKPGADRSAVEAALLSVTRDYPSFDVLSYERLRESQLANINSLGSSQYLMVALLAIPSLLALTNTLGINVLERTRELGVLRAVGATRRQVQKVILGESLLLVAMGTAFGILGGIWIGYVLIGAMNFVGLPFPYFFPYGGVLMALAVGLLFGILAALLPARRAARLDVVKALAFE